MIMVLDFLYVPEFISSEMVFLISKIDRLYHIAVNRNW